MAPGDGIRIPVNHPHWVTTSNEVTISFALTLQTADFPGRARPLFINPPCAFSACDRRRSAARPCTLSSNIRDIALGEP